MRGNDVSENLAPYFTARSKPRASLYYPLPRKVCKYFFALPAMNDSLPAELKFRENAAYGGDYVRYSVTEVENRWRMRMSLITSVLTISLCCST